LTLQQKNHRIYFMKGGVNSCGAGRHGQAAAEYVIVMAILTGATMILAVFLYTFREYSGRVLDLVASSYP